MATAAATAQDVLLFQDIVPQVANQASSLEKILRVLCQKIESLEECVTSINAGVVEMDTRLKTIAHNIEGTDDVFNTKTTFMPPLQTHKIHAKPSKSNVVSHVMSALAAGHFRPLEKISKRKKSHHHHHQKEEKEIDRDHLNEVRPPLERGNSSARLVRESVVLKEAPHSARNLANQDPITSSETGMSPTVEPIREFPAPISASPPTQKDYQDNTFTAKESVVQIKADENDSVVVNELLSEVQANQISHLTLNETENKIKDESLKVEDLPIAVLSAAKESPSDVVRPVVEQDETKQTAAAEESTQTQQVVHNVVPRGETKLREVESHAVAETFDEPATAVTTFTELVNSPNSQIQILHENKEPKPNPDNDATARATVKEIGPFQGPSEANFNATSTQTTPRPLSNMQQLIDTASQTTDLLAQVQMTNEEKAPVPNQRREPVTPHSIGEIEHSLRRESHVTFNHDGETDRKFETITRQPSALAESVENSSSSSSTSDYEDDEEANDDENEKLIDSTDIQTEDIEELEKLKAAGKHGWEVLRSNLATFKRPKNILFTKKKQLFTIANRLELLERKSKELFASDKQLSLLLEQKHRETSSYISSYVEDKLFELNRKLCTNIESKAESHSVTQLANLLDDVGHASRKNLNEIMERLSTKSNQADVDQFIKLHQGVTQEMKNNFESHMGDFVTILNEHTTRIQLLEDFFAKNEKETKIQLENIRAAVESSKAATVEIRRLLRKKADMKILKELEEMIQSRPKELLNESCAARCMSCRKEVSDNDPEDDAEESHEVHDNLTKKVNIGHFATKVYKSTIPLHAELVREGNECKASPLERLNVVADRKVLKARPGTAPIKTISSKADRHQALE
ncbi:hypothetical protein AC1031_017135 [Aphanomyces cochlioides]|nr:hypothetical protein AC1031_017135 [Aphanomyces cochlioides]